jgi:hypothetical protein
MSLYPSHHTNDFSKETHRIVDFNYLSYLLGHFNMMSRTA